MVKLQQNFTQTIFPCLKTQAWSIKFTAWLRTSPNTSSTRSCWSVCHRPNTKRSYVKFWLKTLAEATMCAFTLSKAQTITISTSSSLVISTDSFTKCFILTIWRWRTSLLQSSLKKCLNLQSVFRKSNPKKNGKRSKAHTRSRCRWNSNKG